MIYGFVDVKAGIGWAMVGGQPFIRGEGHVGGTTEPELVSFGLGLLTRDTSTCQPVKIPNLEHGVIRFLRRNGRASSRTQRHRIAILIEVGSNLLIKTSVSGGREANRLRRARSL